MSDSGGRDRKKTSLHPAVETCRRVTLATTDCEWMTTGDETKQKYLQDCGKYYNVKKVNFVILCATHLLANTTTKVKSLNFKQSNLLFIWHFHRNHTTKLPVKQFAKSMLKSKSLDFSLIIPDPCAQLKMLSFLFSVQGVLVQPSNTYSHFCLEPKIILHHKFVSYTNESPTQTVPNIHNICKWNNY